jgi:hypothetical protein
MAVSIIWIVIAVASAKAECAIQTGFDDVASKGQDASNWSKLDAYYGLPDDPPPPLESTS